MNDYFQKIKVGAHLHRECIKRQKLYQREKAIAYYLEGCGFRRIERMLGMSHNSVINWVKQAAKVVQKISKNYQNRENADILELDEMCTMLKKNETKSGYGLL